jgi:hypothetical protein
MQRQRQRQQQQQQGKATAGTAAEAAAAAGSSSRHLEGERNVGANLGVTNIREVRNLAAGPDFRVLGLNKGANLAVCTEVCARAKVGEWPNARAVADA